MSIHILEAGIMDTIQDRGRFGYSSLGINPGGAMDMIAATVANYLVGNDESEAVIELHYPSSAFYFEKPALIAITGADLSPFINEVPVPVNTPFIIPKNSRLQFRKLKWGARSYMAVKGGMELTKWLNSYSTNIKAGTGGLHGRPLHKGDTISINNSLQYEVNRPVILSWHADVTAFYKKDNLIRAVKGKEYELLTDCSHTIIDGNTFIVSLQSDRMGYRMNGSPLQLKEPLEMISSAVSRGTIQLLPNGQVIILMADHQSTGGYPRLAHVISADIPSLAQVQPNTAIRFELVSQEAAASILLQQYHHLQQIKTACRFRLQQYLTSFTQ